MTISWRLISLGQVFGATELPRILNGETVQGQGATGICVNNALVMPNGGTPAWVNPNLVVGQAAYPSSTWNVVTVLPAQAVLWFGGADVVCAGAGTIAAGLNSSSPYTRLQNQQPLRSIPTLIPLDVDRALGIAILYNRSVGNGISVFYSSNAGMTPDLVLPTGPLLSARILSGVVTWIEAQASGWVAVCYDLLTEQYIPVQTQPGSVYQALVFSAQNQRWVLYSNQDGAVLVHTTTDPLHGHTAPPQAFGLDGEVQVDGTLLAAWCGNIGESAGSLVTASWSLTQLEPIGPQPPIPPIPPIPPDPPVPPIPPDPPMGKASILPLT